MGRARRGGGLGKGLGGASHGEGAGCGEGQGVAAWHGEAWEGLEGGAIQQSAFMVHIRCGFYTDLNTSQGGCVGNLPFGLIIFCCPHLSTFPGRGRSV